MSGFRTPEGKKERTKKTTQPTPAYKYSIDFKMRSQNSIRKATSLQFTVPH